MDFLQTSAKNLISQYFYNFSDNLMKIILDNDVMSLSGFPGAILVICTLFEVCSIIYNSKSDILQLERIAKLCLYLGLTLVVYGKVGYSQLNITSKIPEAQRPKGNPDFLRDIHAYLRYIGDATGEAITGKGEGDKDNGSDIASILRKNGLVKTLCNDTNTDKMECVKSYKDKNIKTVEEEYKEKYACSMSTTAFGMKEICDQVMYGFSFFSLDGFFIVLLYVMFVFRFVGFIVVLLGYILTVIMTFLCLKLIFPFIILDKTRQQIFSSVKFFFSTSTIIFILGLIEWITNISMASLLMTAQDATTWYAYVFQLFLGLVISVIIFGVEIALYMKVPSIAKNLWELNLSTFVALSEHAKDGMKLGMQALGLATQGATFGGLTLLSKTGGLGNMYNKMMKGGGEGEGKSSSSGGSSSGSNFSGGGSDGGSSPSGAQFQQSQPQSQSWYGPTIGGGPSNGGSSQPSYTRPTPDSHIDNDGLDRVARARFADNSSDDMSESNDGPSPRKARAQPSQPPKRNQETGRFEGDSSGSPESRTKTSNNSPVAPQSAIDPDIMNRMSRAGRQQSGRSAPDNNSNFDGNKKPKGVDTTWKGRSLRLGKSLGKGLKHVAVDGTKMTMNAMAGNLGEAYNMGLNPLKKANELQTKVFNDNLEKQWTDKFSLQGSGEDLETNRIDDIDLLTDASEHSDLKDKIDESKRDLSKIQSGRDIEILEKRLEEAKVAEDSAHRDSSMGLGNFEQSYKATQEVQEIEAKLTNLKLSNEKKETQLLEEIERMEQDRADQSNKYDIVKSGLLEDLDNDRAGFLSKIKNYDKLEQRDRDKIDKYVALMSNKDQLTSDKLREVFSNPESTQYKYLAKLKTETDAKSERLRKLISKDMGEYGKITAKTETLFLQAKPYLNSDVKKEFGEMIYGNKKKKK